MGRRRGITTKSRHTGEPQNQGILGEVTRRCCNEDFGPSCLLLGCSVQNRMNTTIKGENRFEDDASRYAAYLETPEGRLRADLTFAELQDFLPAVPTVKTLRALDLGCGTGAASVRLARLGMHVTLLDSSSAMLDLAERMTIESGLNDRFSLKCGDVVEVAEIFPSQPFDVILCHNVLEYVEDPQAVLRSVARLMRGPSAILSLLVRNQAGEVLKAALQAGDLGAAEGNLAAQSGKESLYGGKVRFFMPEALEAMLKDAGLTITARRGVRVVSDYLPATVSRLEEYERIFSLERKLSKRGEFFGIARYLHYLARCEAAGSEKSEGARST